MQLRFLILVVLCSIALMLLVMLTLPAPPPTLVVPQYTPPQADTPHAPELMLKDTTLAWKVVSAHQQTAEQLSALTETLGAGICAIDANKDGWVDLFFVGGSGHTRHYGRKSWWHKDSGNRLLLNQQGEYLTDITEQAGLNQSQWGMGCAVADFDNNGWPDLIVTGVGANRIYSNTGAAKFIDRTDTSGIVAEHWSTGASLADFNNDGLTDVYVSNYISFNKGARTFERNKGFLTGDVAFDATLYDPLPNKLYLNQGNFKFRDITADAGVADSLGRSLGARWTDLDGDGWLDLIVINDVDSPSQVYLNNQGKQFVRSVSQYSLLESAGSHDIVEEDFDNDGISELLITQSAGGPPIYATPTSRGKEKLTDHTWESGIANRQRLNSVSWGVVSGDFNNDGNIDVVIANGSTGPDIDSPHVTQMQHNQLLLGLGNGKFIADLSRSHVDYPMSSRSVITADLNNDGNLEIIVTNNNDPLQIFENSSSHTQHWIGLDLHSENSPDQAMGARISVTINHRVIHRVTRSKQGFLASSDNRLHIGLGTATGTTDLAINWPDGTQSFFEGVASDSYYSVNKTGDSIRPLPSRVDFSASFNEHIADYDDQTRVKLGEWLLLLASQDSERQFSWLWKTSNTSVRKSLLLFFGNQWNPFRLNFLRQALEGDSEDLKVLAIGILESLELEYSMPWLIPLLADDSASVACTSAETLQFFFEEEEAVTHRKYLAVAPLIRMLQSASPQAAICAANALAAAESKRAVLPLMELIEQRPEEGVQLAAVRALGLIRDNRAKVLFADIADSPNNHYPSVVAEVLIALKRLDDKRFNAYLDSILNNDDSGSGFDVAQFRVLNTLLTNDENIVFKNQLLVDRLKNSLALTPPDSIGAASDTELAIELLRSIRIAQLTEYQYFAEALIKENDSDVHKAAYQTLFSLSKDWQSRLMPDFLEKEPATVIVDVLKAGGKGHFALDSGALQRLGSRLGSDAEMTGELDTLLNSLSIASTAELLTTLYSRKRTEEVFSTIPDLCGTNGKSITSALSSLDLQQLSSLKYLYLYCRFSDDRAESGSASIQLTDRLLLKQVVDSPGYTDLEKHQLVILAANNDIVTAETILLSAVKSYKGQDLMKALEVLSKHQLAVKFSPFLWELLEDANTPTAIRFEAALCLLPLSKDAVTAYVNSEVLADASS
jgi:ASPIC and UnbV/FG-GAP-like repeat/HEAT repeats